MKAVTETPYEALERIYHEPNRLAIMSHLCAAEGEVSFTELKEACRLTDGNLNRHLKVLEEAGAVKITKRFVDAKPRTSVSASKAGVDRFSEYLAALAEVLQHAAKAVPVAKREGIVLAAGRLATT
jgi:DNA-binding transcriptional ArsR family regulator